VALAPKNLKKPSSLPKNVGKKKSENPYRSLPQNAEKKKKKKKKKKDLNLCLRFKSERNQQYHALKILTTNSLNSQSFNDLHFFKE
jgi:hypothetical protein